MAKLKYFILVAPSFIGGALLAPGSRVTSDDLGTYTDPATGKEKPVKPGETLAEIDERGNPVSEADAFKMNAVADELAGMPIAPVQPFSPNPTKAQAAPAQPPGGVALVEKSLNTAPAEGVESDEAAAARAAHADAQAKSVGAITAETPTRRSAAGGSSSDADPVDKTSDFTAGKFTVAAAGGIGMYAISGPGLDEPERVRGKDATQARLDALNSATGEGAGSDS